MDQTKHDLTAHTRADVMAILNARLADSIDCMHHEATSIKRKVVREMEEYPNTTESSLTVMQRVAICFTAGVLGALAVVLFSQVLFGLGISGALGVKGPVSLKSPDIYRPLFWGGLWGIPFGLFIKTAWERLYLFGLLYFLAPVLALFLIFLPMSGAGYFGLRQGGLLFTAYLLLVNVPFGIITAVAARAIIGKQPWALRTGEQPRLSVSRLQTIRSQHPSTS